MGFWSSLKRKLSESSQTVLNIAQGVSDNIPAAVALVTKITKPLVGASSSDRVDDLANNVLRANDVVSSALQRLTAVRLMATIPSSTKNGPDMLIKDVANKSATVAAKEACSDASTDLSMLKKQFVDPNNDDADVVMNIFERDISFINERCVMDKVLKAKLALLAVAPNAAISASGSVFAPTHNNTWNLELLEQDGVTYSLDGTNKYFILTLADADAGFDLKPDIYTWYGVIQVFYSAITTALTTSEKVWAVVRNDISFPATPVDIGASSEVKYIDIEGTVADTFVSFIDFPVSPMTRSQNIYIKIARKIGSTLEWADPKGLNYFRLTGKPKASRVDTTNVTYIDQWGDQVGLTGSETWSSLLGKCQFNDQEDPNFSVPAIFKARTMDSAVFGEILCLLDQYTLEKVAWTDGTTTDTLKSMLCAYIRTIRSDLASTSDDLIWNMLIDISGYLYTTGIFAGVTSSRMNDVITLLYDKLQAVEDLYRADIQFSQYVNQQLAFRPIV